MKLAVTGHTKQPQLITNSNSENQGLQLSLLLGLVNLCQHTLKKKKKQNKKFHVSFQLYKESELRIPKAMVLTLYVTCATSSNGFTR